ncbi:MAG: hypothetical protein WCK34_18205, partial [Bacteroidota bacterium]
SGISMDDTTEMGRVNRSLIAREVAFTVLMNRKAENGNIIAMTAADRDSMTVKCRWLIEHMNTHVGYQQGWVFYQEWQFRSKELTSYLVAYDLLRGAGVSAASLLPARDSLLRFTASLYHKAMDTYTIFGLPFKFFNFQFDNHSIMTASALGLAAIVLNDNESSDPDFQPQNWINAGMWNLDNSLWVQNGIYPRVSEPDTLAGYAEGPGYFAYAFQNAFPFIRAMGNFLPDGYYPFTFNQASRDIPNPWYDLRYDFLYSWMNRIRMPDGAFPVIHDTDIGRGTAITALSGKPEFNLPNPTFTPDDPFIRTQYIATGVAHGTITDSLFQPLAEAGSLVFRSSWEPDAIYMHFIAKHGIVLSGAKSHHQGDATSFSLFAFGQLLAVDPGYPGASLSDLVNKPADHNLVLVNGTGPLPPNGEFVNTGTNTAYIENFFSTPCLDYGEVRSSYSGAGITRKTLFINHKYFITGDFLTSGATNDYTFQLHGNGLTGAMPGDPTGACFPDFANAKVTYQRDSVHLLAMVQNDGSPAGFTMATDSMAINGGFRHYTKTLVTETGAGNMLFLTTLYPWVGTKPDISQAGSATGVIAGRINGGLQHEFFFAQRVNNPVSQPASVTGLAETLTANGNMNLWSADGTGNFSIAFLENGDSLVYGFQPVIRCDRKLDVAYEKVSDGIYAGFVSAAGTVDLFSDRALKAVSGAVTAISYHADKNLCSVTFSSRGNFRLEPSDGLTERPGFTGLQLTASPNPSQNGLFRVTIDSKAAGVAILTVTDHAGHAVSSQKVILRPGKTQAQASLSGFPAGAYEIKCSSGSGFRSITLVNGLP